MNKVCKGCKEEKPLSEFHRNKGCKYDKDPRCKPCKAIIHRKYHKENPKKYTKAQQIIKNKYSRDWRKKYPEKVQEYNIKWWKEHKNDKTRIDSYLKDKYAGVPCMDCDGVFPWCVMDFDHRPEETKTFTIGSRSSYRSTPERTAETEKEILKCDIVCSNCHRIRTFIKRKK